MSRNFLIALALLLTACSEESTTDTAENIDPQTPAPPEQIVYNLYKLTMEQGAKKLGPQWQDRYLEYRNVNCRLIKTHSKNPAPVWSCMLDVKTQKFGWTEKNNMMVTFHKDFWRPVPKSWKLY